MGLLSFEHGKVAYQADFVVYGTTVLALLGWVVVAAPPERAWALTGWMALGGAAWTLLEYALHRFVLHGVQPFKRWHLKHHERPLALICTPTVITTGLFATLVFVPALLGLGLWNAVALTLGVLAGYLAYAVTHHATHHWHGDGTWLRQRKRWHAVHHHSAQAGCYGVTSGAWDRAFGSVVAAAPARAGARPPR